MDEKKEIRVMVIGDFLIFRNGLKLLLETEKNINVVGEAADFTEALGVINQINPDVLLIESTEIDNSNFEDFILTQPDFTPVIVLTSSNNLEKHQEYLLLGVDGLVSKQQNAEVLFKAIRQVSDGDVYFDRKLMRETIRQLVHEKKSLPQKLYSYNCAILTDREQEVLVLICQGMKNKAIADKLFITETTVRHHLTSIFEKLKVNSRLELVVHAFKEKLVAIPSEDAKSTSGFR